MAEDRAVLVVEGLTAAQKNALLYDLKEETIGPTQTGLPSTALGDFGATALLFLASAAVIAGILKWVGAQEEDIAIKFKILKIVTLEVTKKTSLADIQKGVTQKGLKLE